MTDATGKRFDLTGRRALITGGSRGIGRAIALALAEAGADVAVHCGRRVDAAEEVARRCRDMGRRAAVIAADLTDPDAPERIAREATDQLGAVDILIPNASVQYPMKWRRIDREHFDEQVAVNFRSAYELIQRLAPAMVDRRWGRIVTVGSVQQHRPATSMVPYAALKSALENMCRNLAKQFAPHGVTVNNVSPGIIDTERNEEPLADPEVRERIRKAMPMQRFGEPADCVGAVLLLCSEAGAYITGIDVPIDGGFRLP